MHMLTTARSALAEQASGRTRAEEDTAKLRHALRSAHAAAEVATVTAEAEAAAAEAARAALETASTNWGPGSRPVSASADTQEVRNVAHVVIREDRSKPMTMLFDEGHALDERILREQFSL
jgi:hypothetical protein